MDTAGPGRGTRDNGLRCANYVAIADLDPRVADALLTTLRDNGIAAYAAPTPGSTGGYMETRLPSRLTDRLWVDDRQVAQARRLVDAEAEPAHPDLDTAWQQVLASLQTPTPSPVPPWPVREDVETGGGGIESHIVRPAVVEDSAVADAVAAGPEDEHFEPPPPPPLPRLRPATLLSLASVAFGLLILATQWNGGDFDVLGVLFVLGGVANLVYHMRQGPPTDSGWDDGAVV